MLTYTTPQIDFVLEMAAKDETNNYNFSRSGKPTPRMSESLATWTNSLAGRALLYFMAKT